MGAAAIELANIPNALGSQLVRRGKLTEDGLARAVNVHRQSGEPFNLVLASLGLVPERDVVDAYAALLGLETVVSEEFPASPLQAIQVSEKFLQRSRVLPIRDDPDALVLAMADPLDDFAAKAMELAAGKAIERRVATVGDLESAFTRLYSAQRPGSRALEDSSEAVGAVAAEDIERLKDLASEAPVIRFVNALIARAVESRASDIHIEPFDSALVIRFRIDGALQEIETASRGLSSAITSRVKIMAKLDIAERRLPQDGRIRTTIRGQQIDLRVSTMPTMYGESVVLRVLDRGSVSLDFAALSFEGEDLELYRSVLERPHGIVLVTGPTGSGKTTTLYASLVSLNTPDRKIFTVEDPIEYHLDGINQVQVKPQIGLNFAHVLRSILRQDPDIVMVGEIRDLDTAEVAIQAALTGHLVLSTLHTNDAASSVTRLLDMGVEDFLLTSTINGIVAQRLVRLLCDSCRQPYTAGPALIAQLGLDRIAGRDRVTLFRASGCAQCNGTGYRGRTSLLEILVMSDAIRGLVLRQSDAREIGRVARQDGMRTLFQQGLTKALAGFTSLEEVFRVTHQDER